MAGAAGWPTSLGWVDMNRQVLRQSLGLGVVGGVLIAVLKWTEYQFLVIDHSVEIYGGLTAATFAGLGIWLGVRATGRRQKTADETAPERLVVDEARREALGLTPRELEILGLIAEGLSNREIAGRLFVSENTVKTHCSRTFDKLGAKRRTQAVQMGKELGLLR